MIARDVDEVSRRQSRVDEKSTKKHDTCVCDLLSSYVLGVRLSGLVPLSLLMSNAH